MATLFLASLKWLHPQEKCTDANNTKYIAYAMLKLRAMPSLEVHNASTIITF